MSLSEEPWTVVARAAQLHIALADFPDDVAAAAATAANAAASLVPLANQRSEPWPPMRAGTSL